MKKLICIAFLLPLTITLSFGQHGYNLRKEAEAAAKDAQEALETVNDLCDPQDPDQAADIREALDKAREAVKTAEEALENTSSDYDHLDDTQEAVEEAREAYDQAKSLAGGMQIEHWVNKYADSMADWAEENSDLCPGERGTAQNLLDDIKAKATELAEANPCDSTAVRDGLEEYLKDRNENGCEKVKEFIQDFFTVYHEDGEDSFFLPKSVMINFIFSGATSGVIGTWYITNNSDQPQDAYIPEVYIAGVKGIQPQITDGAITISIPANATVEADAMGYCMRVDLGAPEAGSSIDISAMTPRPKTPANGATLPENGWVQNPDSDLINPVSGKPLGMSIDFDKHPDQSWFLFEAKDLIKDNYIRLLKQGKINPPFGSTPLEKQVNYCQQALWGTTDAAYGMPEYTEDQYVSRVVNNIESTHNILMDELPEEQREDLNETIEISVAEISLVGGVMKVKS